MAMQELKRKKAAREWLLRNLTTSVILYERVETTEAKAKEVRRWVDRMINVGKTGTLANRRLLLSWFPDRLAVKKIFEVLIPRYSDRTSGYARLFHVGIRPGDGGKKVLIELIGSVHSSNIAPATSETPDESVVKPKRTLPRLTKPKATVTVRRKSGAKS